MNVNNAHGQVGGTVTNACIIPNRTAARINPQPNLTLPILNDFPKYLLNEDCKYPLNNSSSPNPTINI